MAALTLQGEEARDIEFVPLRRAARVRIRVEAERPIHAYLVDEAGLEEFNAGEEFTALAGSDRASGDHLLSAFVPRGRPWFLLLVNSRRLPVAVFWEEVD